MANTFEIVTQRVIEAIEKDGVLPWEKPWKSYQEGGLPINYITKKPYRGINVFLLALTPYSSPYWLTFKQAKQAKGWVRKGEKATPIVFWSIAEKEDKETGEISKFAFAKTYSVFNLCQCENIEIPELKEVEFTEHEKIAKCESVIEGYKDKPTIKHKEDRAFYSPVRDLINMPKMEAFDSAESYYSTLYHEAIHSVGHQDRLARKTITNLNFFGSHDYSKEELIAELGASFLCAETGINNSATERNSVAYLNNWLKALKGDSRLIVDSARIAQKSVDYILGKQFKQQEDQQ